MFRLKKIPDEFQDNMYSGIHRKVLHIVIIISSFVVFIFSVLDILDLVDLGRGYLVIDLPIRISGLVAAFIFNLKHKTGIAKYIFIVFFIGLSMRLLVVNTSESVLPILLLFFLLFPVYISFFIHPKAGLYSGFGFILFIMGYYVFKRIWQPQFFEEKYVVSFTNIFLTPIVLIIFFTIAFYYFTKQNKTYIKQIEQSATHTVSILNSITDALLVLNETGIIKTVNKAGLKIFEYSTADLVGKPFTVLFMNREDGDNLLDKIFNNMNLNNYKSSLKTKSGKEIIAGLNSSLIYSNNKKQISEIIITARDLTRLYKYTKKLKRMNRKAQTYQLAMLNMLEDLNEKNRKLLETEHQVKEYSKVLEENIEQAKEHQTKLITVKTPNIYNMRFSSEYIPCEKVGGDIINIIVLKDYIYFYIADVVGHGVPAAILSSYIKASLDNWIKEEDDITPNRLLVKLYNVLVDEEIFRDKFFTIFIGKISLKTLELHYISAGHLSPILFNLDNGEISEIKTRSRPVISMFELESNKHYSVKLPEKSRILVYSDGLIEWEVDNGEFFGKAKLFRFFQKEKLSKKNIDLILQQIRPRQLDDISFILIEINNTYEKKLHCRLDNMDVIISEFEDEIRGRYRSEVAHRVSQCFAELVANAIEHGNGNDPGRETYVNVSFYKDRISLCVKDSGNGFNWKAFDFKREDLLSDESGNGLARVSDFSDSLEFNDKGNEVTCIFHINA